MRKTLMTSCLTAASLALMFFSQSLSAYTQDQQTYLDASRALDNKQYAKYRTLRSKLNGYPLAVYLDYNATMADIIKLPGKQAAKDIEAFAGTPLYNSARYRYLLTAGKAKRWGDFLAVAPERPNDVRLQCFYQLANYHQGNKTAAFEATQALWLYGKSRPAECDPLFALWSKAGHRSQGMIWSRLLLSFNAGQYGLVNYLAQKITRHKAEAKLLVSVYKDPNSLRHTQRFSNNATIYGDIVDAGLRKLALSNINQAIKLYKKYHKAHRFGAEQDASLNHFLVRRALIFKVEKQRNHIDTMLPKLKSDELFGMRMRWAIGEKDDATVEKYLAQLSPKGKADPRWQYWQIRITGKTNPNLAQSQASTLSQERNFYGFYAAQSLNAPLSMNDAGLVFSDELKTKLNQDSGLARVTELLAIKRPHDARTEWIYLLRRHDNQTKAEYGLLALENGWYNFSVEASIQGEQWNALNLRFPLAAQKSFEKASKHFGVNIDEIRAISRRESAFHRFATSGVGARGMMQLMPATAKETARKYRLLYNKPNDLYRADNNIMLGSAYYSQILKQFNGNRVLATAAYNAGPHRVKRWLADSKGQLDVMSFIETIPYTETREYVQAVLSYRMIYQQSHSPDAGMFTPYERNFAY
ncbi:transglycosylase SLT domain-containing protein [Shewanella sp.]|uniref:transglycosylase SLT domain-containing protein n=1 Tax=Shewanella sp. TaxID=50422 RepID=UPI0040545B8B